MEVDQVEDAILAKLKNHRSLSYVADFSVLTTVNEEALQKCIQRFPHIGIISPQGEFSYASGVQDETARVLVLCFQRNLRSASAATRSAIPSEKGLWTIMDDVKNIFIKEGVAGVIECLPKRRSLLWAGEKWACASLDLSVRFRTFL